MITNKVVTVTLNPALDLTGHLGSLNSGLVNLVNQGELHAAGKGVNVAQVLSDLGAEVTVTGFLGTDNQELFCQLFEKLNVTDQFIRVDGATRINVKLVEESGATTDINFPGVEVLPKQVKEFEKRLFQLADQHDYFVIAGSLPQGIEPQRVKQWIDTLRQMDKKVLFDSSRTALEIGLRGQPWLIKPNNDELSELVGQRLNTAAQCQQAAQQLADQGIENIVISMGAKGVMWLADGRWLQSVPPHMDVVSTVGAGDTLVAGLCWGHMQNMERQQLLSFATALSAIAVSQIGVGLINKEQLYTLQNNIKIQEL